MPKFYNVINGVKTEITGEDAAYLAALQLEHQEKLKFAYREQRAAAYPPLSELADALYWQTMGDSTKMEAYIAKVEEVKQRFPKPEGLDA